MPQAKDNQVRQENEKNKGGKRKLIFASIIVLVFSLIFMYIRHKEILPGLIPLFGFTIAGIRILIDLTGFNLREIRKSKEEHPEGFNKFQVSYEKYKHFVVIGILIFLNIMLVTSVIRTTINQNNTSEENYLEINMTETIDKDKSDNIDVIDDELPTISPEIILSTNNSERINIPHTVFELYLNVVDENQVDLVEFVQEVQLLSKENKEQLKTKIYRYVLKKCGIGFQPTDEEINRNSEFVEYTQEANRFSQIIDEKGMDELILLDVIDLRTRAYHLVQTKSIRTLLANDYYRLGEFYYKTNRIGSAQNYLLKSIELRSENLQILKAANAEFYGEIYKIGTVFSMIADIEGIEKDTSLHASLLACCFFELASLNSKVESNEEIFFLSSYYGGVANHSILRAINSLGDEVIKEASGLYICDGIRFYERSLEAKSYNNQIDNQYRFINQIADIGLNYLRTMEIKDCYSVSELEDIKKRYSALITH